MSLFNKREQIIEGDWSYPEEDVKEFIRLLKEEKKKGCGKDFLSEFGSFELMCGKHIWKSKTEVEQYNLCEDCLEELEFIDKLAGKELLESKEKQ